MAESQTFHLVDGHAGTAHIDSYALARKNQSTLGYYDDILPLHSRLKVTVLDATHVQLWNGGGFIRGRFFYIDGYTKLEVKAGRAWLNRWDALVLRYHRDSDGVETVSPLIITGTPTSGQPTMPPTLENNDIEQGNRDADLLLGRIELTGTNISYTELAKQSDSLKNIGVNLQQEITERQNAIRGEQQARQNAISSEQRARQNDISRERQERAAGDAANANAIKSEQQARQNDISRERKERQSAISGEQAARQNGDAANAKKIEEVNSRVWGTSNQLNDFKRNFEVIQFRKLVSDSDAHISGVVVNGVAIISLRWTNRGGFHIGAWSSDHPFAEITNGWKTDFETGNWSMDNSAFEDCWFSFSGNRITFRTRSTHDIAANTWHLCTITAPVHK